MKKIFILMLLGFSSCSILETGITQNAMGTGQIMRSALSNKIWQKLGEEGFIDKEYRKASIAVYNGITYRSFIDNNNKVSVMKFDSINKTWTYLGDQGFANANELDLVVNSMGIYVAFTDIMSTGNKFTVMKLNGSLWANVGKISFGPANPTMISLAVDNGGVYVAYRNPSKHGKVGVHKLENGTDTWRSLNGVISVGKVKELSLELATDGIPYIAYIDMENAEKVSVMKYHNNAWTNVGRLGFTPAKATKLSFTIDKISNVPYIAYTRPDKKISLMQFNGAWVTEGGPTVPEVSTSYFSLAVDNGWSYILYADGLESKATLMSYNGNWQYIGNSRFSKGAAKDLSVVVENEIPYVAYKDSTNNNKVVIMKYDSPIYNNWINVGIPGFSAGEARHTSLQIAPNGTPYIAFQDITNGQKVSVMKFNGTYWQYVGLPGFSTDYGISSILLQIDQNGTPYITFTSYSFEEGIVGVMKFNGTSWQNIGSFSFGTYTGISGSLSQIDQNGTPYIAFTDYSNSGKSSVMKFNGTSWQNVGSPGFSSSSTYEGSLQIAPDDTPYIVFRDTENDGEISVMKFNGTYWQYVGPPDFSAGSRISDISLEIDPDGTPYIAFQDNFNNGAYEKVIVMKFNGTSWQKVGSPGFIDPDYTNGPSLQIAPDGTPYIAFKDYEKSGKATVMKLNGTSWQNVASPGFSGGIANDTSLQIAPNGTPYVAFTDEANYGRATVMKAVVD